MKKIALTICLLSFNTFAADLHCTISRNQEIISETEVTTSLKQKTAIDNVAGIYAFITETNTDHYIVEAFLGEYDMRIYGEGSLKASTDKVGASIWGRDSMIDVECQKSQ